MRLRLPASVLALALALAGARLQGQTVDEFLYTTNWNAGTLTAFRLNGSSGALTPVPGSPFPGVPHLEDLAIHPGNQLLYAVSTDGLVTGYRIAAATGALTAVPGSPYSAGIDGTSIAIDRQGRFLYTSDPGLEKVYGFAIDAATGALSPVPGSPFLAGNNAGGLVLDPSDRFLYAAISAAPGERVLAYAKGANGALTRLPGEPATGQWTRSMAVDLTGRYLYAANASSDTLWGYSIDPVTGQIAPLPTAPFPVGAFPGSIRVAPAGRHAYVTHGSAGTIGIYTLDPPSGALVPSATVPAGGTFPDAIVFDPLGRFAYVANRASNTVTTHDVDVATGGLSLRIGARSTGAAPSAIAVTRFQPPVLAITDVTVDEAAASAVFTVTALPAGDGVTAAFTTIEGTAEAGRDYVPVSGSLSFGTAPVSTVTVPLIPDDFDEDNETFSVRLTAGSVPIVRGEGVATIVDDDPTPDLAIHDTFTFEGQTLAFPVLLSASSGRSVSVEFSLTPLSATPGVDYGPVSGRLVIPPGAVRGELLVPVFDDYVPEGTELVGAVLSSPTNVTLSDGDAQGSIQDSDAPGLAVDDVAVRERRSGPADVTFTVSLFPASSSPVSVQFMTGEGNATAGVDYTPVSGTLDFPPGQTSRAVTVSVAGDGVTETPETFRVILSAPVGAPVARDRGTAVLLDPPRGGDFNADGRADLLWRHEGSGEIALWYMNGVDLLGGTFTNPPSLPDAGWRIAGSNDFNSDGRPDILWRHTTSGHGAIWYMNGATLASGTLLSDLPAPAFRAVGTADLDFDGDPDIVWRNASTGLLLGERMEGALSDMHLASALPLFRDLDWEAVGLGDFNRDVHMDVLWRHRLSGQNAVWFLKSNSGRMGFVGGALLDPPALADTRWRVAALEDYDDDGDTDIVWRHSQAGQDVIWFMNGTTLDHGAFTTTLPDTGWSLVGPR